MLSLGWSLSEVNIQILSTNYFNTQTFRTQHPLFQNQLTKNILIKLQVAIILDIETNSTEIFFNTSDPVSVSVMHDLCPRLGASDALGACQSIDTIVI